jgi:hypothetical protein
MKTESSTNSSESELIRLLKSHGYSSILDFDSRHRTLTYFELSRKLKELKVELSPINIELLFGEISEKAGLFNSFLRNSMYRHFIESLKNEEMQKLGREFALINAVSACSSVLPKHHKLICTTAWNKLKMIIPDDWMPSSPDDKYLVDAFNN